MLLATCPSALQFEHARGRRETDRGRNGTGGIVPEGRHYDAQLCAEGTPTPAGTFKRTTQVGECRPCIAPVACTTNRHCSGRGRKKFRHRSGRQTFGATHRDHERGTLTQPRPSRRTATPGEKGRGTGIASEDGTRQTPAPSGHWPGRIP